jgi:hypothetical protein
MSQCLDSMKHTHSLANTYVWATIHPHKSLPNNYFNQHDYYFGHCPSSCSFPNSAFQKLDLFQWSCINVLIQLHACERVSVNHWISRNFCVWWWKQPFLKCCAWKNIKWWTLSQNNSHILCKSSSVTFQHTYLNAVFLGTFVTLFHKG